MDAGENKQLAAYFFCDYIITSAKEGPCGKGVGIYTSASKNRMAVGPNQKTWEIRSIQRKMRISHVFHRMENTCFLPSYQEIHKEERLEISIGLMPGAWE